MAMADWRPMRTVGERLTAMVWLAQAPSPGGAPIGETGPVAEGFIAVAVGLPILLLVSLFVARHGHGPDDRGRTPAERGDRGRRGRRPEADG